MECISSDVFRRVLSDKFEDMLFLKHVTEEEVFNLVKIPQRGRSKGEVKGEAKGRGQRGGQRGRSKGEVKGRGQRGGQRGRPKGEVYEGGQKGASVTNATIQRRNGKLR